MSRLVWHYTFDQSFSAILKDGFIRPADGLIGPNERPITWFSREQYWEPTVYKGVLKADGTPVLLNMTGLLDYGVQLFRIGVDSSDAPHRWSDLKALSGMPSQVASGLARTARQVGANPSRWHGTFETVPVQRWKAVEYFNPGADSWASFYPGATDLAEECVKSAVSLRLKDAA